MIILSDERFNTFKKSIVCCVYAEVTRLEFDCLCGFENTNKVIQVKNENTNETAFAEILVMMKHKVHFNSDEKARITVELRPSKKNLNCKFYNGIRFYKNNDLTD